jgi:hypothetical protein
MVTNSKQHDNAKKVVTEQSTGPTYNNWMTIVLDYSTSDYYIEDFAQCEKQFLLIFQILNPKHPSDVLIDFTT